MFRTMLCLALAGVGVTSATSAASFVVDTTSDAVLDACNIDTLADCSLRGAITAANAIAGAHQIDFDLSESDAGYVAATQHWRFAPATDLPAVTRHLTIDGFSQDGAAVNATPMLSGALNTVLKVELSGPGFNSTTGLTALPASSLFVRGLAINGFNTGVALFAPEAHRLEGNFIGTDITGQIAAPNRFGIAPSGTTFIGGTAPAFANLISGNEVAAIASFRDIDELQVQGNFIGPAADGQRALPGQDYGLQLTGQFRNVVIGGNVPAAANVISGHDFSALYLSGQGTALLGTPHARIQGNYIGTDVTGLLPIGNGFNPGSPSQVQPAIIVFRGGDCGVAIGGGGANEGNLIAFNAAAGVQVGTCRNAPILGNRFLANGGLPIDNSLSSNPDGATANDAGDDDDGGNRLQNSVELLSLVQDSASDELRLSVLVDTATSAATYPLRIDVYRIDEFGAFPVASEIYPASDARQPHALVLPLSLVGAAIGFGVTDANSNGSSSELLLIGDLFRDGFEGDPPPIP